MERGPIAANERFLNLSFFTAVLNGLRRPSLPAGPKRMFALADGTDENVFALREATMLHQPEEAAKPRMSPPIFIQAMWRASSTYIWKKFRDQPRYRAYCEPLHEVLSYPREVVERANGPETWQELRHPVNDEFYFAEFPFSAGGGVEYFDKSFSFERYCLDETEPDEPLRRYIAHLIDYAESHGQRPVLQFNRGLLRAGWLSRQFRPIQILLLRRPLHLWKSFLSHPGHSFDTYISMIFGQNREKAPLRYLPSWLDFPRLVRPTLGEEWVDYQAFTEENAARLYPSFFDLSVLASVHCAQFADCILDMDEITRNPEVRRAATERLRELGIRIDLEDCAVPSYDLEAADSEWLAYEEFSRAFLRAALPDEISISRDRMKMHEPLLGPYFRELLAGFTGRRPVSSASQAAEKSAEAIQLFAGAQFEPAARRLGEALAEQPTSTLWNDWAVAQAACSRPHLAELGFGQSLRHEPVDREAAGNLGALLFSQARTREALPLLERAELETDDPTRSAVTNLVNQARQSLGLTAPDPDPDPTLFDLLREQCAALQQVLSRLANLEQRFGELSEAVSRPAASASPAILSDPGPVIPKPRRPRASGEKTRRPARSSSDTARGLRPTRRKQQRSS
jgi:hypothetical protein